MARNERLVRSETGAEFAAFPLVRSLRAGVTEERVEIEITRPDGSRITCLFNSSPLHDENGQVTGSLAVFQDITQLKDAEQLKDDFLSLIAHELRTPLTTVQGGAMLLQRHWAILDAETRSETLDDISTESRRLAILIDNTVQLANIRAGRLKLDAEPTLVEALLRDAVTTVGALDRGRDFRLDVEPGLVALADPGRIDQVVRNLLHNAIKYAPGGTPIEVSARAAGDDVEIAVRDHGPGITEDALPHIFGRFERGAQAVASGAPGLGLGLYLCRQVIELHHGHIWIERPVGGGTRVAFTLPAAAADEEE
jgi:signal transduction histidine kinase